MVATTYHVGTLSHDGAAIGPVDVAFKDGRLVLTSVSPSSFRLVELLGAITGENLHSESATGERAGNEAW